MKQIKKTSTILLIVALMFTVGNIQAQPGGQHGPPPIPNDSQVKEIIVKLTKELSLSDSQEEQISALYYANFKEARALAAKKASRKEMEQLKAIFEKNVKSLLTSDQQKKFVAYQKKNQPQGGKPRR